MDNLFSPEEELRAKKRKPKKDSGTYEEFVAKFNKKLPKTTDDCYTPQPVYEAVVSWIGERVDLRDREIICPFYLGGDYVNEEYSENCIVIDNPPFSIISKLVRFYTARGIDFFMFAPALTLFNCGFGEDVCYCVTKSSIEYENGAKIATGFVTSLFKGCRILIASSLTKVIEEAQKEMKKDKMVRTPRYDFPKNVVTAARLQTCVGGDDIVIPADECYPVRKIANMKGGLFGSGFLLSDAGAAKIAERIRRERVEATEKYEFVASEIAIVEELNKNHNKKIKS